MILFGGPDIVEALLEELEGTPGMNDKIELLRLHKSNPSLRAYLDIALNPYRVYHVKKMPVKDFTGINQAALKDVYSLGGLAKYLECLRGLHNKEVDVIYYYFEGLSSALQKKWAEKAILKQSIAGIGAKSVNKAFQEPFIPVHDIMLMSAWKEPLEAITYPVCVQEKLDGFRCTYIPNVGFTSRSGLPIANRALPNHLRMGNLISAQIMPSNHINCVFDGELYSHKRNFNEIASILSTTDKPIPKDIKYYVFNIIPLDIWNKQQNPGTYIDQMQFFTYLEDEGIQGFVEFIKTHICKNSIELKTLYQQFLDKGLEGAIVRSPNFSYAWKRLTAKSQTIFKLKPFDYTDAKIIGFFEGIGKLTGMLGGFNIELEDGTKLKVGSGFKESQRILYWGKKEGLVGEWLRLKFTEKTPAGSLRFPIFDSIRDAKN